MLTAKLYNSVFTHFTNSFVFLVNLFFIWLLFFFICKDKLLLFNSHANKALGFELRIYKNLLLL